MESSVKSRGRKAQKAVTCKTKTLFFYTLRFVVSCLPWKSCRRVASARLWFSATMLDSRLPLSLIASRMSRMMLDLLQISHLPCCQTEPGTRPLVSLATTTTRQCNRASVTRKKSEKCQGLSVLIKLLQRIET